MIARPLLNLLTAAALGLALPAQAADPGTSVAAASAAEVTPVPAPPAAAPPRLALQMLFANNSAQIRPESGVLSSNLAAAMRSADLEASRFQIEGHTDAAGSAGTNLRLSQMRAERVRSRLVALGVDLSRLQAAGRGSSEPLDTKNLRTAANRRVQVVTLQ